MFKQKLKIVHVITGLNTGGAEMMLTKLIAENKNTEVEQVVISLMGEGSFGSEIIKFAKLYTLNIKAGRISILALQRLYKIIKQEDPDVIQGWMYHANIAVFMVNLLLRKRISWNIRQSLMDIKKEKLLTAILIRLSAFLSSFVDLIIFNSHTSLEQHIKIGFHPKKLKVIPNGFELLKYNSLAISSVVAFKRKLMIPVDAKIIGHVARYHPMKDHLGFVQKIKKAMYENNRLYCIMIGKNVDADNMDLNDAIISTGCAERFRLLGERKDLANIYGAFDFTVNTSLWGEAFPNVIGESMACGTPCVVSNIGDSKRIIANYGYSFEPNDSKGFSNSINEALELSREDYLKLSIESRGHIKEKYGIKTIFSLYISNYLTLVDKVEFK